MTTKATWKELKAQGIARCCAVFTNGKQCRRRAAADGSDWAGFCTKHGATISGVVAYHEQAIAAADAKADRTDDQDEE